MVVDRLEGSEQQWGQCPAQKSGRQAGGPEHLSVVMGGDLTVSTADS